MASRSTLIVVVAQDALPRAIRSRISSRPPTDPLTSTYMLAYDLEVETLARTTILLKDELLLEVRRIAHTKGITITEVIKDALNAYVKSQPRSGLPSFTAVARSKGPGTGNLARNAKKLVARASDPHEGSHPGNSR